MVSAPPLNDPNNPANPKGRGHQIQPALTFAGGKLLVTWLDQRYDHTEGVLQCQKTGGCTNVSELVRSARAARQPGPGCTFPAGINGITAGSSCYRPDAVFSTYLSDGTPYLIRRHTMDVFAATAAPADVPRSVPAGRVSQYLLGSAVSGAIDANGKLDAEGRRRIRSGRRK